MTANEGDVREYSGLNAPKPSSTDDESVEIEDIALDPLAFPKAAQLQDRAAGIGRLKVTSFDGDTDGDGDYDRLYAFGARSFSIWSAHGALVFDSGDALERITAAALPERFNASNTNNIRDDRSDDKGPEPEGVTIAKLFGRTYLFVMLERIGGVASSSWAIPARPALSNTSTCAISPPRRARRRPATSAPKPHGSYLPNRARTACRC